MKKKNKFNDSKIKSFNSEEDFLKVVNQDENFLYCGEKKFKISLLYKKKSPYNLLASIKHCSACDKNCSTGELPPKAASFVLCSNHRY